MIISIMPGGSALVLYKRYIDDIFTILEVEKKDAGIYGPKIEDFLNNLDKVGCIVKVDGKDITAHWIRRPNEEGASIEFLDINTTIKWSLGGVINLETSIYREKAAADMYTLASSAHPEALQAGLIKGECIRFMTRSSTEAAYDKAWNSFEKAILNRGYREWFVEQSRGDLKFRAPPIPLDFIAHAKNYSNYSSQHTATPPFFL